MILGALLWALLGAGAIPAQETVLAPGWSPLKFEAPVPGTYELPPLGEAADGELLDTRGTPRRLHELFAGRVVLMSFIYTRCPDVNACPLATYVLRGVQQRLLDDATARGKVRLLTVSLDPERDRPDVLREHSRYVVEDGSDWQFLTAESEQALAPILRAYGQSIRKEYDEKGESLGTITHVLRVHLIDQERRIRNIYSSSFLHADTVWSDILTLLGETTREIEKDEARSRLHGPGDDKRGYETEEYQTRSRTLTGRKGETRNLLALMEDPPLGLPPVPLPAGSPPTAERMSLGRKLFFDRRLSRNNTMSCAMCHVPEQGFTTNEMATAVGIEGQTVRRNAPTTYNVAYARRLFHDAREERLEQQIWGPLLAPNEMGNPSVGFVLKKIRALDEYKAPFEAAFPDRGISMETLGIALATYERGLLSGDSAFDRWYFGKADGALTESARRGFELFRGKARCTNCHRIGERHALFTDHEAHNTGIGYRQTMGRSAERLRLPVAPGVHLDIAPEAFSAASEPRPSDLGVYEITGDPNDRWKYRTPTLRNVALTAPYMHDGSIRTLREVVELYDRGGIPNPLLDPLIEPLGLDDGEIDDLVAFLESLTGSNVDALISDAFAAPVGDPG